MGVLALFYYTLAIMLVSIMASALCLSSYLVARNRGMVLACVGFFCYFLDVALVFQDDFILRGSLDQVEFVYFIGSPLASIVTGWGTFTALWLFICVQFEERRDLLLWGPGVVFAVGSLATFFFAKPGGLHEFMFYSMRGVYLFWILGYVGARYLSADDPAERSRMWRHKIFYAGAWVWGIAIIVKNAFTMLIIDPELIQSGAVPFFPERNFFENILMIWCAAAVCIRCFKLLALHFKTPPANESERLGNFIESGLAAYSSRYGLSARESEVLGLVLSGKDNQAIATSLSLALSTVKVHVHSILKKTGCANRQELMRDFRMYS